jgi:hypothetical protein
VSKWKQIRELFLMVLMKQKKKKKRRLEQDLCFLEASADTLLNKAESSHSVKYVTEAKQFVQNWETKNEEQKLLSCSWKPCCSRCKTTELDKHDQQMSMYLVYFSETATVVLFMTKHGLVVTLVSTSVELVGNERNNCT